MRFSVLTLNLRTSDLPLGPERVDRFCAHVAENNISCACVQGLRQTAAAPLVDESGALREDNDLVSMQRCLERYGLKYGRFWSQAATDLDGRELGCGVLSQLPVLGACGRAQDREEEPAAKVYPLTSMVELAVAPSVVIDVYSVEFSGDDADPDAQIDGLWSFIESAPAILESLQPPPPKRRGPPRKRTAADEPPPVTRLHCVAGHYPHEAARVIARMKGFGFLEASESARSGAAASAGGSHDYVFIRPALRPHNVRLVELFRGLPGAGEGAAVAAEFEV